MHLGRWKWKILGTRCVVIFLLLIPFFWYLFPFNNVNHSFDKGYGFWQDNVSYHDCMEESYHIWGESWMMQFGYLPTGGYFYRPPYIGHGPFQCEYGTYAIFRTDSWLVNHFNWNPYLNPEENRLRVVDKLERQKPLLGSWSFLRSDEFVTMSGSLVLGLAVLEGRLSAEDGWDLSRIDEDWQIEQWGEDEEEARRVAVKRDEFLQARTYLDLLRAG